MKHKHCDLIKAWADGAEIQIFHPFKNRWDDIRVINWIPECEYRIKPESKKCRVGLLSGNVVIINHEDTAICLQNYPHFIKWLTDWIPYEPETGTETSKE